VTLLNALLVRGADLVQAPLAALPAAAGVGLAALATALVILGLVRVTSDQVALASVKRQIQADLFEMRLFNDDLRALLRAQIAVLAHNGRYLRLSLLPLVCTAIPLALGIAQLQAWYGYSGLAVGAPVLVTADLAPSVAPASSRLDGEGVRVDGEAMHFPTLRQLVWRVVPTGPGAHRLQLHVNGATYDKSLVAADGLARRSPVRPQAALLDQLLEPSEPPVDAGGPLVAIHVPYPERSVDVFGFGMHWLVLYLAASFVFVLLLRKPLGVVI
jgi:uncharacterized membrane protein (DUF106 family)